MTNVTERNFKTTPLKGTPWYAYPIILIGIGVVAYTLSNVQVVMTDSIDATIVWPIDKLPKQGDLVNFKLTNKVIPTPDHTVNVTKILTCSEGQYLAKKNEEWTCNGMFIGKSRSHAMNGDKLEQFSFNGEIPKGKSFLTGTHKNSFDSRYWGFADNKALTTVKRVL